MLACPLPAEGDLAWFLLLWLDQLPFWLLEWVCVLGKRAFPGQDLADLMHINSITRYEADPIVTGTSSLGKDGAVGSSGDAEGKCWFQVSAPSLHKPSYPPWAGTGTSLGISVATTEVHTQISLKKETSGGDCDLLTHAAALFGSTTAFLPMPHFSRDAPRQQLNTAGSSCPAQDLSHGQEVLWGSRHWPANSAALESEALPTQSLSSSLSSRRCQNSIALCGGPCLLRFLLPFGFTGIFPHKALAHQFPS